MSLEAALADLTAVVKLQNELTQKLLGAAGAASASGSDETETKPKGTRGRAKKDDAKAKDADTDNTTEDSTDDGAVSFADLRAKLSKWLGEFAKEEDKENPAGAHPEVGARREALGKALGGLKVKKLPEIEGDDEKIAKLDTWYESKAKNVDKGFGKGRLVADPEPAEDASSDEDDDGMGI